jgi:hypothetical protein
MVTVVLLLLYLSGVFEHARTVFVEMPDWLYDAALALFLDKGGGLADCSL